MTLWGVKASPDLTRKAAPVPSGSSMNRGYNRAALAVCAILAAACNSSTSGDAGMDAGQDSGPVGNFCKSVGGDCSKSATACCTNLTCQNGACAPAPSICAGYLEACDSVPCCEPSGDAPLLLCQSFADAGLPLSLCVSPAQGTACSSDSQCPPPYVCAQGACGLAATANSCDTGKLKVTGYTYHTPCEKGDACLFNTNELGAIESNVAASDPCLASGLVCILVSENPSYLGLCVTPAAAEPQAWSPDGPPFDTTVCNPKDNQCGSYYTGADRAAATCGPFMIGAPDHCEEACTTGDDCDNITWDCIKGQCKPNYCYADGTVTTGQTAAKYLSGLQTQYGGLTVSGSESVLFQPCATGEDFPTACLPQYDDLAGGLGITTTGECVRVGGDGGGGWGDPCDPNPYRNNLGGLCQFGNYCYLGTCMPWCDLGSTSDVACPSGTTCQPLPAGPLASTVLGATHSIGVCAQDCDPYLDDTQNDCPIFQIDAGPKPLLGCKLSGNGSDTLPPPGNCAALIDQPIAVGQPCVPGGGAGALGGASFEWLDPCVSGAQCTQNSDAGLVFVCRQVCDPDLSDNIAIPAPACPEGQTCVAFQTCGGAGGPCAHQGGCE